MKENSNTFHNRLIPLTEWHKYYSWPPIGGLRHLVFHSETNGFDKVIRRVGRKVLLDETAWHEWVRSKNPQAGGGECE